MRDAPGSRLRAAGVAAVFLAAAAVTAAHFYVRTSLQPMEGDLRAAVDDTVTVKSDRFAVPHVFARDEADLFYAQGWLHATHRLWQMELLRRIARGRLAAVFGEEALATDRLLRTLDLWGAAGRGTEALAPQLRAKLEAYAAGVNDRIETWSGAWPPEFLLLGLEPEPWTPRASVAVGKVMALDLSVWRRELSRFHARLVLPASKRRFVEPGWPAWGPTVLPRHRPADPAAPPLGPAPAGDVAPAPVPRRPEGRPAPPPRHPGREPGPSGRRGGGDAPGWDPLRFLSGFSLSASNNWALSGRRTRSGRPLVANDMHLGLRAPALWYAMGLHAKRSGLETAGMTLPGVPGVVVGFNEGVAWSFTNAMVDDMDFAVETLGRGGSAYLTGAGWRELAVRPETIRVRGRDRPVVHRVRETVRGPLLSDVLPELATPLSALWAGSRATTEAEGLLAMNRATEPDAFGRAVEAFDSPQQNVVFAAVDGTLGYRLSGRIPRRSRGAASGSGRGAGAAGMLPASALAVGAGWAATWPPGSHPAARIPAAGPGLDGGPGEDGGAAAGLAARGFVASANNLQAPGLFGVLGVDYPIPFRARRIVDRLSQARGWTRGDAARLQRDTRSLLADRLVDRAVDAARRAGADSAAALLSGWNRRVDRGSRAASVFYAWVYRLRSLMAADEFAGTESWAYFPMAALLRVLREGDPAGWADDVATPRVETVPELEETAVRDAVEATGMAPWGDLHRERHVHPLGRVAWLDRLFGFHVGPYPSPGAPRTVRPDDYRRWRRMDATSWRPPWMNEYGPSQRLVVTLGPGTPAGAFLLPTGQSGNPLDPHYRDMSRRWRAGGAPVELPLSPAAVDERTERELRLVPAGAGAGPAGGGETPAR